MPEKPLIYLETELHSDVVNDIISYRPHWLIRNGIGFIGSIILTLMLISWFIEYPDLISASMRLIAVNAPKKLVARTEGKLEKLWVHNGQQVKKGDFLAFIQSSGRHQEVLEFKNWLDQLESNIRTADMDQLKKYPMPMGSNLGELQPAFVEFEPVYLETLQILGDGYYPQKMSSLKRELILIGEQESILKRQKILIREDYQLQLTEFNVREKLVKEKVLAPLELIQDKSKLIAKENALNQIDARLVEQQAGAFRKEQELRELNKLMSDQKSRFITALFRFKNSLNDWLNRYVIRAPEQGNVQFIAAWQENQHLQNGQDIFYIVPENHTFYGEILASQSGVGKIALRQKVLIKLDSYPSTEYGYLSGHIDDISPFPLRDSSFVIRVALPEGVKTNYGKILPYKNNLQARAEIITENRRLLERFTSRFQGLFERK